MKREAAVKLADKERKNDVFSTSSRSSKSLGTSCFFNPVWFLGRGSHSTKPATA